MPLLNGGLSPSHPGRPWWRRRQPPAGRRDRAGPYSWRRVLACARFRRNRGGVALRWPQSWPAGRPAGRPRRRRGPGAVRRRRVAGPRRFRSGRCRAGAVASRRACPARRARRRGRGRRRPRARRGRPGDRGTNAVSFGINLVVAGQLGSRTRARRRVGPFRGRGEHVGEVDVGAAGQRDVGVLPVLGPGDHGQAGVHGPALGGVVGDRVTQLGFAIVCVHEGAVGPAPLPRARVGVQRPARDQAATGDGLDAEQVAVGQRPAGLAGLDAMVVARAGDQVAGAGLRKVFTKLEISSRRQLQRAMPDGASAGPDGITARQDGFDPAGRQRCALPREL